MYKERGEKEDFRLKIALGLFYNAILCHASNLFPFFLCKLFFSLFMLMLLSLSFFFQELEMKLASISFSTLNIYGYEYM